MKATASIYYVLGLMAVVVGVLAILLGFADRTGQAFVAGFVLIASSLSCFATAQFFRLQLQMAEHLYRQTRLLEKLTAISMSQARQQE